MKWYGNLKTGAKMAAPFGIIIILVALLSTYAIYVSNRTEMEYTYLDFPIERADILKNISYDFMSARYALAHMSIFSGLDDAQTHISEQLDSINDIISKIESHIDQYKRSVDADTGLTLDERSMEIASIESIEKFTKKWRSEVVGQLMQANLDGRREDVITIMEQYAPLSDEFFAAISDLTVNADDTVFTLNAETSDTARNAVRVLIAASVLIIIVCLVLAITTTKFITKPINSLAEAAIDVSEGDFNIHVTETAETKNEIKILSNAFMKMARTINELTDEIEYVAVAQSEGVTDILVDEQKYKGKYSEIAELVNNMITEQNTITNSAINCVYEIGNGNFGASVQKFPGDKAVLNKTIELLRENLINVHEEMSRLVNAATSGNLESRAKAEQFRGDWTNLMSELNSLLEAVTVPIHETVSVLEKMSVGDFNARMNGVYKGDYLKIKNSVNSTVSDIGGYIKEISSVLASLSSYDFTVQIERDYIGEFQLLKDSINHIISYMNKILSEIKSTAESLNLSSTQISNSSMVLAEGAADQTKSVTELSVVINDVADTVKKNALDAEKANTYVTQANQEASLESREMKRLLRAMNDINKSSDEISKVIKVIQQ